MDMDSPSTPVRPKAPVLRTLVVLLACGMVLGLPFAGDGWRVGGIADWVKYAGRFHPMILHIPIGVFAWLALAEVFRMLRGKRDQGGLAAVGFGAFSAVVAAVAGFLLARSGGYEASDLLGRHMWGGLAFAVFAMLTCVIKSWTDAYSGNPSFYRMSLFLSAGVMCFAGHDGGSITHGSSYLTEAVPKPVRGWLGLDREKPAVTVRDMPMDRRGAYVDLVAPVLERRCVQCHNASKAKGRLRMDSYAMLLKGGGDGPAIEPGNAAKSKIMVRMALPEGDEDHMPPNGKPGLDDRELSVLTWWLQAGADPVKTVGEMNMPADVMAAAEQIISSFGNGSGRKTALPASANDKRQEAGGDPAMAKRIEELSRQFPGVITLDQGSDSGVIFSAARQRERIDDAAFETFAPLASSMKSVDLSATKITDRAVAALSGAVELRMIRLAETGVTDATVDVLVKLPKLESINLYGTAVSDTGARKLVSLPGLKHLYLWRTKVTPVVVDEIRKQHPECEIVAGS